MTQHYVVTFDWGFAVHQLIIPEAFAFKMYGLQQVVAVYTIRVSPVQSF